jgi:hypothetical protein
VTIFKSYDEMDASHRAAYDLGRAAAEARLREVEAEKNDLMMAAIRLCNVHRWSYGGPDTLRALADRIVSGSTPRPAAPPEGQDG